MSARHSSWTEKAKISPEEAARRRQAGATSRAAAIADTPRTTRPGSEATDLKVGDRVRVTRTTPGRGTWSLYDGREGFVAAVNAQKLVLGTYVEIGVAWSKPSAKSHWEAETWFRADELVKL